ncbi:MAG TPA: SRPBCC family protein [Solirubrobacteraceae bacterium]|nr:SRPBCC family protein [Solirubrobacteraceae bacterium]
MPSVSRRLTIEAPPDRLWELVSDPHHLPRWWPAVERMEGVEEGRFTQVLFTRKGRPVRIDYRVVTQEPPHRQVWEQDLAGTPFERVLSGSVIEVLVDPVPDGAEVTISQRQQLRGYSRTGGWMLRRATRRKLDQALEGLAAIA